MSKAKTQAKWKQNHTPRPFPPSSLYCTSFCKDTLGGPQQTSPRRNHHWPNTTWNRNTSTPKTLLPRKWKTDLKFPLKPLLFLFSSPSGDHNTPIDPNITPIIEDDQIFHPYFLPFLNPRKESLPHWLEDIFKKYIHPTAPSSDFHISVMGIVSFPHLSGGKERISALPCFTSVL